MGSRGLRDRTKQYVIQIVRMFAALPKRTEAQVLGKQALRSGTSVAANYREACRARSVAEFTAKMGVVEQELDETLLRLEMLVETQIVKPAKMAALLQESEELLKFTVASIKSARRRSGSTSG